MKRNLRLIVMGLAISCGPVVFGDVLHLRDGTQLEGEVRKSDAGWNVLLADGTLTEVTTEEVQSIVLSHDPAPTSAAAGLESLRRSAEAQSDAKQVVERYKQFIDRNAGTPAADDAEKDLAVWQSRVDQKLAKLGGTWVTQAERTQAVLRIMAMTDDVRRAIRANQTQDATDLIQKILQADARQPAALYLRAILEMQKDQGIPARKDLEAVNAITPNHLPTLNNLAVVNWRQNHLSAALNLYDQAMRAQPYDRTVLDNVAEALNATGATPATGMVASSLARVRKRFAEQDAELQRRMAEQFDLHRWGGTWLSGAEYNKLQSTKATAEHKLADTQGKLRIVQQTVAKLNRDVDWITNRMKQLEAESYTTDSDGNVTQQPLPSEYDSLNGQWAVANNQRTEETAKLKPLEDQVNAARREIPVPKFTGMQQLIGPEGAPVVVAP